jgi:hypothetical protein
MVSLRYQIEGDDKMNLVKELVEASQNISRVGYVFGVLEGEGRIKVEANSNDALFDIWRSIYEDWGTCKDIRNEDEEGYIVGYAQRVLLERYGVV